jgi:hypothetical protein
VHRLLLLGPLLLVACSCSGGGSGAQQLGAGRCISGAAAIEVVDCGDPAADYRLVSPAISIADPEPRCDGDEVMLQIQRTFTDGPLAGGSQPVESWCAVPV